MKFLLRSTAALVLLTLAAAFAQTTSAPTPTAAQLAAGIGITNPQNLKCADPAVQNAVAYLVQLGATGPNTCVDMVVPYPGGESYANSQLQFTNPKTGVVSTFSAGLTAVWPGITAQLLSVAGDLFDSTGAVITLPATFQASALQPYQLAAMPAPVVNTPPVQAAPASPIGPKVYPGTPDAVGDQYYTVPRETYLPGSVYTDAKGWAYRKFAIANPFGNTVFWLRIQ